MDLQESVLIIEDSPMVSRLLVKHFTALDYLCSTAMTLHDAREELSHNHYDLVTLDLHLPDGEGDTLLDEFDTIIGSETQVVVYTADQEKFRRESLFQHAIMDYFVKDGTIIKTVHDIDKL